MDKKKYILLGSNKLRGTVPNIPQNIVLGTPGSITISAGSALDISNSATNHYFDANFRDDRTTYPSDAQVFGLSNFSPMFSADASAKAEIISECKIFIVADPQYAQAISNPSAGNYGAGHYIGNGIYDPQEVTNGNVTNTVDFSTIYDAVRFVVWVYWDNASTSDQFYLKVAEGKTAGTSNHGVIQIGINQSYTSVWDILTTDGNGNLGHNYFSGGVGGASATSYIYGEFVAGSHVTARKLKQIVGQSASGWDLPSSAEWEAVGSEYYATKDLTSSPWSGFVPISVFYGGGSSDENQIASVFRVTLEYRPIGGSWQYLT